MKKTISLFVLLMLSISILSAQKPVTGKNPSGKWKFEAPYAPEGYTSGIIELTLADNAYSTSISFTGNDYKIPADKTKVEQDSISFSINVEGSDVSVSLKIEEANKMSGKALYAGGEIPLILTRETMEK